MTDGSDAAYCGGVRVVADSCTWQQSMGLQCVRVRVNFPTELSCALVVVSNPWQNITIQMAWMEDLDA